MKISDVIKELEFVREKYGEIEVALQNNPRKQEDHVVGYESFFIVPEEYEEVGFVCNIRNWPY